MTLIRTLYNTQWGTMAKILAVDDNQDNLIVISALLKDLIPGCEIISAQSGASGIEKAIDEKPDTILLDVRMPEIEQN